MSFASNSLRLIRSFFDKQNKYNEPYDPFETNRLSNMYQWGVGPETHSSLNVWKDTQLSQDLQSRYVDYTEMQYYPEIGAALEIFSDEATRVDTLKNRSIWVESENESLQEALNYTMHNILRVESSIWDTVYTVCAMGDAYQELIVEDRIGVVKLIDHPAPLVRVMASRDGVVYGYLRDDTMAFDGISTESFLKRMNGEYTGPTDSLKIFEPWEIAHFKIQTGNVDQVYGRSIVDPARYAWKRLTMIEDAMVLFKLTRAPQRYVFYVDVGDIPPNEARATLEKVKHDFKKQKVFDSSGQLSSKATILSQTDDFFIAKRKGERTSEIDILAGLDGQSVDDAEYFRSKLISALKIPKAYLGYDETVSRSNIGQQDIRLAKTVMRIQRVIKEGWRHILQIDLAAKNVDPDKVNFEIKMAVPSGALEIAQIEVEKAKVDLAAQYQSQNFSEHFIWSKILGVSDEDILKIRAQRKLESVGDDSAMPPESTSQSLESKSMSKKELELQQQITENMEKGTDALHSRLRELRGLVNEMRHGLRKKSK